METAPVHGVGWGRYSNAPSRGRLTGARINAPSDLPFPCAPASKSGLTSGAAMAARIIGRDAAYRTNFTPAVFPCHQTNSQRRRVPASSNANSKWVGMAASPCTIILAPLRETSDTTQGRSAQPCFTSLAWIRRERRASRGNRFIDRRMASKCLKTVKRTRRGRLAGGACVQASGRPTRK